MPEYTLSYLDAAKEEYYNALIYYKERSVNAAVAFESAIETIEGLIKLWPHIGRNLDAYPDVEYLPVPNYPYILCYRVSDYDLEIVAICLFNTYRDPKKFSAMMKRRTVNLSI